MTAQKTPPRLFCFAMLFCLGVLAMPVQGQVKGCKDPAATNYNPSATVADSSCIYSATYYTPPVKVDTLDPVLKESSGLQMAGGFLWSFNDSGNEPAIYRIDTTHNKLTLQTVTLGGATNVDWEDIAFDGTYFYIGDFGNNADGARQDLKIYKFKLSDIADYRVKGKDTIPAAQIEIINFRYQDQPNPPVPTAAANSTRFDCEAMIVDGGKIHLFTKNWLELNTTHYVINSVLPGAYVATPVEKLATGYLVTAADKASGANVVALLGYLTPATGSRTGDHFMHLLSDYQDGFYFSGNRRKINLPTAGEMGQAEGITFLNETYGYISNERLDVPIGPMTLTVVPKLRSFNTNSFVPAYVLPLHLQNFSVVKRNGQNQISWHFSNPVKELKLQHSTNRTDFATVQTPAASASGSFLHTPAAGVNCYRLFWKDDNGVGRYSDVVCVNNGGRTSLSNMVLRNSGELSFVLNGSQAENYAFRLLTADGKLVAQTATIPFLPGANNIRFSKVPVRNGVFLLQAVSTDENRSLLLRVQ